MLGFLLDPNPWYLRIRIGRRNNFLTTVYEAISPQVSQVKHESRIHVEQGDITLKISDKFPLKVRRIEPVAQHLVSPHR